MGAIAQYFQALQEHLARVQEAQQVALGQAAESIAEAIAQGGAVWTTGSGHSALLAQEVFYRAGGLMLVNFLPIPGTLLHQRPAPLTSQLEKLPGLAERVLRGSAAKAGDVIIVISTSGRNAVPVEAALVAREMGLTVIALTSSCYQGAPSRHPSRQTLAQAAHLVVDTMVPVGDAALTLPGLAVPIAPLSGVVGAALLQALLAGAVECLLARGVEPPVFISGNVPGGPEHNQRLLAQYADRLHYL